MFISIPDPDETSNLQSCPPTPTFEILDQDIVHILEECETESYAMTQKVESNDGNSIMSKQVVEKRSSLRVPIFHNCTISGNITINLSK